MTKGAIIRKLREERGESMGKVSRAVGISAPMLSDMERDFKDPSVKLLERIADYFGVSTDYLLGRNSPGVTM